VQAATTRPRINPPLNPPAPRMTAPLQDWVDEVESVEDSIPPGTLTAGLSILPRSGEFSRNVQPISQGER
jgi:hypothetical protein